MKLTDYEFGFRWIKATIGEDKGHLNNRQAEAEERREHFGT